MSYYKEKYNIDPRTNYDKLNKLSTFSCDARSSCSCNIGTRTGFDGQLLKRYFENQQLSYPDYSETHLDQLSKK